MDLPRFVIEASEAESMAKELGLSVLQLLPSLVKSAQKLARPPISKYHVGAVGLGADGRIFFGVNLEFPGLPLHHSVHAEQFLLTNLAVHGGPLLRHFAVSAAPCGHCRQFIQELRNASEIQILITSSENDLEESQNFKPLSSFLPNPFGPFDLLDKETPLLLEPHDNGLSLVSKTIDSNCGNLCNGVCQSYTKNESELKMAALEAANSSHAPYSGCPSGVALMDAEGRIYTGSYMESAAYNPSLGPVQAAIVAYVASGGGGGYDRIVAGVLVEKEDVVVRQEDTARLLLNKVSPKCQFRVFHCSLASNGCKRPASNCE
ncbi:cytidine deaminase 1-like [Cornus florida]|uniref:cytidine deaminase 1-like n=1 Tax=Cornus florida TaxID=4283 RepID=UPI00289D90E6|nr:cytidine deaminase 1-like [Cornus florida]